MTTLTDFICQRNIIHAIDSFVEANGGGYTRFYVGITNDIDVRLFQQHKVDKQGFYIVEDAKTKSNAQFVESYFLDKGMQGDTGGGKDDSTFVYCYLITPSTKENTNE